jgi:hypothetical protein
MTAMGGKQPLANINEAVSLGDRALSPRPGLAEKAMLEHSK